MGISKCGALVGGQVLCCGCEATLDVKNKFYTRDKMTRVAVECHQKLL